MTTLTRILTQIYREKVAILGALAAVISALTALEVISPEVGGTITAVAGGIFVVLRAVLVPAEEVVVQRKAGDRAATAGPASPIPDGTEVVVRRLSRE